MKNLLVIAIFLMWTKTSYVQNIVGIVVDGCGFQDIHEGTRNEVFVFQNGPSAISPSDISIEVNYINKNGNPQTRKIESLVSVSSSKVTGCSNFVSDLSTTIPANAIVVIYAFRNNDGQLDLSPICAPTGCPIYVYANDLEGFNFRQIFPDGNIGNVIVDLDLGYASQQITYDSDLDGIYAYVTPTGSYNFNSCLLPFGSAYDGEDVTIQDIILCEGSPTYELPLPLPGHWELENTPITNIDPSSLNSGEYTLSFIPDPSICTKQNKYLAQLIIESTNWNVLSPLSAICLGKSIEFYAQGPVDAQYYWVLDESIVSNEQRFNYYPASSGYKSFTVIAQTKHCSSTSQVNIVVNDPPSIPSSISTPTTCGNENGSILLNLNEDLDSLKILWNDGVKNTLHRENLPANTYFVNITNLNTGCTTTRSFVIGNSDSLRISVDRYSPSSRSLKDGKIEVSCLNCTKTSQVQLISEHDTTTLSLEEDVVVFDQLSAGHYLIILTDSIGCSISEYVVLESNCGTQRPYNITWLDEECFQQNRTIVLNIDSTFSPDFFRINVNQKQLNDSLIIITSHDSLYLTVFDTISMCRYEDTLYWESYNYPEIKFEVQTPSSPTESDGKIVLNCLSACNNLDSILFLSQVFTRFPDTIDHLSFGSYSFRLFFDNNCFKDTTIIIRSISCELGFKYREIQRSCDNQTADVEIFHDSIFDLNQYEFRWSSGMKGIQNFALASGTHIVYITRKNFNCYDSITIDIPYLDPPRLLLDIQQPYDSTNQGNVIIESDALLGQVDIILNNDTIITQTELPFLLDSLSPMSYVLEVKFSTDCHLLDTFIIVEFQPNCPTYDLQYDIIHTSCGLQNGGILLADNQDIDEQNISLLWMDNRAFMSTNNLNAGLYTLYLEDKNQCKDTFEVLINDSDPLLTDINIVHANSDLGRLGTIQINCSNCLFPLTVKKETDTILLSNALDSLTALSPGLHRLEIEDANSCQKTLNIYIHDQSLTDFIVPNVWKPSEKFGIYDRGKSIRNFLSFNLFDRWGNKLFTQKNLEPNSNGIFYPITLNTEAFHRWNFQEVYIYTFFVELKSGKFITISGELSVLR